MISTAAPLAAPVSGGSGGSSTTFFVVVAITLVAFGFLLANWLRRGK